MVLYTSIGNVLFSRQSTAPPPKKKFTRANNKEVRNATFAETLFQVIQFFKKVHIYYCGFFLSETAGRQVTEVKERLLSESPQSRKEVSKRLVKV